MLSHHLRYRDVRSSHFVIKEEQSLWLQVLEESTTTGTHTEAGN
jgi:hypothetical protein